MSSYYLTLNHSKTEFFFIGLPQQTSKIINPSLSLSSTQPIPLTSSAKNLGFIFNSNLSFFKHFSSLSSICHYHIRDYRVSVTLLTLRPSLLSPLPLSWLLHLFLTMDFLSRKLNAFNKFKIHLPALSPAPLSTPTLHLLLDPFSGSRLNSVYITK